MTSDAAQTLAVIDLPVVRVERRGSRRHVRDFTVDIRCHRVEAPPDDAEATMRNAVHALAAQAEDAGPEQLARSLARFCMTRIGPMNRLDVEVRARSWQHLDIGGRTRERDLAAPTGMTRVARATIARGHERTGAGFRDLQLLSPDDAPNAIELLRLDALWRYGWTEVPFDTQWQQVRRAVTEAYSELDRTRADLPLAIAQAVLAESPAVAAIEVRIERALRYAIDMSAPGAGQSHEVYGAARAGRFVHEARVRRDEPA